MYVDDVAAEIGALSRKLGLAAALILGAVTLLSSFVIWQSYQFERRRHGAAEELRASEIRFRELFNNMSSGVVVGVATDEGADFILKDLNHAAEQLTGVNRATALNRSFLDVFAAFRDGGLLEVLQRVWRTGLPEFHAHTRRSAGRVTLSTESYVYRLPAHEVVIVTDDVTERTRPGRAARKRGRLPAVGGERHRHDCAARAGRQCAVRLARVPRAAGMRAGGTDRSHAV